MVAVYEMKRTADTPWARFLAERYERAASLRAMALQLGVAATTLEEWLYAGKTPKPETIRKLAGRLRMPYTQLRDLIDGGLDEDELRAVQEAQDQMARDFEALEAQFAAFKRRWLPGS